MKLWKSLAPLPGWAWRSFGAALRSDELIVRDYSREDDQESLARMVRRIEGALDLEVTAFSDPKYLPELLAFDICYLLFPTVGVWVTAMRDRMVTHLFTSDTPASILGGLAGVVSKEHGGGANLLIPWSENVTDMYQIVLRAVSYHIEEVLGKDVRATAKKKISGKPIELFMYDPNADVGKRSVKGLEVLVQSFGPTFAERAIAKRWYKPPESGSPEKRPTPDELLQLPMSDEHSILKYLLSFISANSPDESTLKIVADYYHVSKEAIRSRLKEETKQRKKKGLPEDEWPLSIDLDETKTPIEEWVGTRDWGIVDLWNKKKAQFPQ